MDFFGSLALGKAARMMELLRDGDQRAFQMMLSEDPRIASLKGPGGSTPLMYAVLYGDADAVRLLLDHGADGNAGGRGGRSILMDLANSDSLPVEAVAALIDRGT